MPKQVPIKQEYIEELNNLEKAKKNLVDELGKIGLQELLIEKRRDKAESYLDQINNEEPWNFVSSKEVDKLMDILTTNNENFISKSFNFTLVCLLN